MRSLAPLALVAVVLASCTSTSTPGTPTRPSRTGSAAGSAPVNGPVFAPQPDAPASAHQYYLSLGDSYPAGYQPDPNGPGGSTSTVGYPYRIVRDARTKGYDFHLVNLACSGATTASMLTSAGCNPAFLGPDAPGYTAPQTTAAETFLRAHRGHVGLVTVSIGGNDFLRCGAVADPISCATSAVSKAVRNLGTILRRLRAAAGAGVRIVGTTYPDIFLGTLAHSDTATNRDRAELTVTAFRSLFNPQLERAYAAVDARFVDLTRATGGYGSLSRTTKLAPYGRLPVPVAKICELTWFCSRTDVHPTPAGHELISKLIVATLPRR